MRVAYVILFHQSPEHLWGSSCVVIGAPSCLRRAVSGLIEGCVGHVCVPERERSGSVRARRARSRARSAARRCATARVRARLRAPMGPKDDAWIRQSDNDNDN